MTTKLSKDGYKIIKKNYSSKEVKEIKDELKKKGIDIRLSLLQRTR